jgi:uncharacterized surface protein with fasciclin (FAS1) repeats
MNDLNDSLLTGDQESDKNAFERFERILGHGALIIFGNAASRNPGRKAVGHSAKPCPKARLFASFNPVFPNGSSNKECVMSFTSKLCISTTVVATILATCQAVEACEKTARAHVTTVAFKKAAKSDIVDTAVGAGSFKTLAAALKAAGLVETLKGKGPFTVFAPTDDAFAKLPPGTVEDLLKDKDKLTAILTYHVVTGNVKAADVAKLTSAKTVQGQSVAINATDGVKVNNAKVTQADIDCSNGVIHVIDAVLLPKGE